MGLKRGPFKLGFGLSGVVRKAPQGLKARRIFNPLRHDLKSYPGTKPKTGNQRSCFEYHPPSPLDMKLQAQPNPK
jgi:hypothetical protein